MLSCSIPQYSLTFGAPTSLSFDNEGQLEGTEGQPEGFEGQPEGFEGLPRGSEGLSDGSEGQLRGGGQTHGWMCGQNFCPFFRALSPIGAAA